MRLHEFYEWVGRKHPGTELTRVQHEIVGAYFSGARLIYCAGIKGGKTFVAGLINEFLERGKHGDED